MSATVNWSGQGGAAQGARERRKRELRQRLTDTATTLFVARGFDAVPVAEIAQACGVSEKTVYNHFPSKEALVLDHPDAAIDALRAALADPDRAPVDAVLAVLSDELTAMTTWLDAQPDPKEASEQVRRFNALIQTTPALRAHQRDLTDRLVTVAAQLLADRAAQSPDDPEPRIAAIALVGLWQVQFAALRRYLDGTRGPAEVERAVAAEVRRAATLISAGLGAGTR